MVISAGSFLPIDEGYLFQVCTELQIKDPCKFNGTGLLGIFIYITNHMVYYCCRVLCTILIECLVIAMKIEYVCFDLK